MPVSQIKTKVNNWLARAYDKVKAEQDSWFAKHGKYFQLPRFPKFPPSADAGTTDVLPEDLDAEQDDPIRIPDDGAYEVQPTTDVFGFVMDPGTLKAGRTWEVAPATHPTLPYYATPGTPAPMGYEIVPSWRRALIKINEVIPSVIDFSLEVNVYKAPGPDGHGWQMKAHVLWDNRNEYWTRAKAEGPQAVERTWNWRQESTDTGP